MPTITVISPSNILVNGIPAGALADTIANRPELTSDIQLALEAYDAQRSAAYQSSIASIGSSLDAAHEQIAALTAQLTAAQSQVAQVTLDPSTASQ
jgi:multidrug resistance efflux pump